MEALGGWRARRRLFGRALLAEPTLGPVQTLEVYDPLVAALEAVLEHRHALVEARTLLLHHVGDQLAKLPTDIRDQLPATGKLESRLRRLETIDTDAVSTPADAYRLSWLVRLFGREAKFARWCGTGAVALSSGEGDGQPVRHRLDTGGNRRVNSVLHIVSVTQQRDHPDAQTFLARKAAEGKTRREARRAHKRHLANRVIRRMGRDEHARHTTIATAA
jgi:hypothetical protein